MGINDDIGFGTEGSGFSTDGEFGFGGSNNAQSFESTVGGGFGNPFGRVNPVPDANVARAQERENPYDIFRDRRDQALERLRAAPGFDNRAIFTWGEGLQNLPLNDAQVNAVGNGFGSGGFQTVGNNKKNNNQDPNKNGTVEWSEQRRVVKVIKVASEEDPDTYIKVKVPLASVIQTDEKTVIMRWLYDTQGAPGAGASTSDEDDEDDE